MSYDLPYGLNQSDIDEHMKTEPEHVCEKCDARFYEYDGVTDLCPKCDAKYPLGREVA